jgi:hypothetical protein
MFLTVILGQFELPHVANGISSHLISVFETFGSEISSFDARKHGDCTYMEEKKNA